MITPEPEVTDEAGLAAWLSEPSPKPAVFQSLDLSSRDGAFAGRSLHGCAFLDCALSPVLAAQACRDGAFVVSRAGALPFARFPHEHYTVASLYQGFDPAKPGSWAQSYDHRTYAWFITDGPVRAPRRLSATESVSVKLHDAAMEHAVGQFLDLSGRRAVAFMGGHDAKRSAKAYRDVATLARELHRLGFLVVTGGGPGLMEAANLGAFLGPEPDAALDEALSVLSLEDDYAKTHDWLSRACEVRAKLLGHWNAPAPAAALSLGIPTWLYGHEPPNVFASHIAKFFHNALREDGLVTVAGAGIVFAEGNAGTVQEIFQDATQNYYRGGLAATPMVLLGREYWDRPATGTPKNPKSKPLYPLIRKLAEEKGFLSSLLLTDDLAEVRDFLVKASATSTEKDIATRAADVRIPSL